MGVHDVDGPVANAHVAQARLQALERNHGGQHAGKLAVGEQRHRHHQRGAVILTGCERLTDRVEFLVTGLERAPESGVDERIAVRGDVPSRGAFRLAADRGDVQDVRVVFDEVLKQARDLGRVSGIVDVLNPARDCQDLALAQELLTQSLLELQGFVGEGAGDLALLDALGILQLFLAEPQGLAVIEPKRRHADEQQRTHDDPQDAQSFHTNVVQEVAEHAAPARKMLSNGGRAHNGTIVLGLPHKPHAMCHLGTGARAPSGANRCGFLRQPAADACYPGVSRG